MRRRARGRSVRTASGRGPGAPSPYCLSHSRLAAAGDTLVFGAVGRQCREPARQAADPLWDRDQLFYLNHVAADREQHRVATTRGAVPGIAHLLREALSINSCSGRTGRDGLRTVAPSANREPIAHVASATDPINTTLPGCVGYNGEASARPHRSAEQPPRSGWRGRPTGSGPSAQGRFQPEGDVRRDPKIN